jgi:rare lipoprotein A
VLTRGHHSDGPQLPQGVGQWYKGLAAPYGPSKKAIRGACGTTIKPATMGVAHPVLPCGVKIYLSYGGTEVLTQVIDRGPNVPGRTFDVTRALARQIGLTGTQPIKWRFAR